MVGRVSNRLVTPCAEPMHGQLLAPAPDLHLAVYLAHRHFLPCCKPGNRVAVGLVGDVSVSRYPSRLLWHVGIGRTARQRLQVQFLLLPGVVNDLVGGSMHPLIGDLCDPAAQLRAQIVYAAGLPPTEKTGA